MISTGRNVLHADIALVSSAYLCDLPGLRANYVDYVVWFELIGDGFETYVRYLGFFNCNYIHITAANLFRPLDRAVANLTGNLIDRH